MHEKALKKEEPVLTIEEVINSGSQVEITLSEFFKQRRELSKPAEA